MNEPYISTPQVASFLHVASSGGRLLVYGYEPSLEAARDRASHARTAYQAMSDQVVIARVLEPSEPTDTAPRLSFVEGWVRQQREWRPARPPRVTLAFEELRDADLA